MSRFEVDPIASAVAIAANSTVHPVHISASGLSGFLEGDLGSSGRVDLAAAHHAWLTMPVGELRSGNVLQDIEMERRMETARFPSIDCEVDRLADNGDGTYRASARVMVHGQTRAVEADVVVTTAGDDRVVIEVEHVFDMRDFGISPPRLLMLKVDPQVAVKVRIDARRTAPGATR